MPTTRTAAAIRRDLDAAEREYTDLAAQCGTRVDDERNALKAVREKHDALKAKKLDAWQRKTALAAELAAATDSSAAPPAPAPAAAGASSGPTTADPEGAIATAPSGDPDPGPDPGSDDDQADGDLNTAAAAASDPPPRTTKKKRTRRGKAGG